MIDFNDIPEAATGDDKIRHGSRYDLDELAGRLAACAESWVPRLFPQGRREGDTWRLSDISGGAPNKHGSCEVMLRGEYAGWFTDWETGERGGPLVTIARASKLSGRALYDYAAGMAGVDVIAPKSRDKEPRSAKAEREITFILSRSRAPTGTPVESYLASRGLTLPASPDLLFNPDVTYWDTRTSHPAMIAIVRDGSGQQVAIHRTYLAADGTGKATVQKPKMMLGPTSGGCVRLGEIGDAPVVGLAEGIETSLAVLQSCPSLPVWAALSAGNMERADLPPGVNRVVLLADHDTAGTGHAAAERAARRHHSAGRQVWIAMPSRVGDDFNDMLLKDGQEAVRICVEAAVEWLPTPESEVKATDTATYSGEHRPVGFPSPHRLPVLRADNGDLADLTAASWQVLQDTNTPPWLFRCGGRLSWVERDDDGHPTPMALTEDRTRHVLARLANWAKTGRTGDLVPAHPPINAIKDVLATPDPSVPVLAGVVAVPVFGSDGELITTPGYHRSSRLLYEPPAGFTLPPVPASPSSAEIAAARGLLLDDLLGDFPFTGEAERAHALALLLLPFVRPMISGPTPLHLIEKPSPGTGATLMVEAIAQITTAAPASIMVEGREEEEWRTHAHAHPREGDAGKHSETFKHSVSPANSRGREAECRDECPKPHSAAANEPSNLPWDDLI